MIFHQLFPVVYKINFTTFDKMWPFSSVQAPPVPESCFADLY